MVMFPTPTLTRLAAGGAAFSLATLPKEEGLENRTITPSPFGRGAGARCAGAGEGNLVSGHVIIIIEKHQLLARVMMQAES